MNKKAQTPRSGVFYLVPDAKRVGQYILISDDGSDRDTLHIYLFDRVQKILEKIFNKIVSDAYTGVPRGRVIEPVDRHDDWLVVHGGDFPLDKYRNEIILEFGLGHLDSIGKVRFEVDPHEKMNIREMRKIENDLGIQYTSTGWKKR